MKKTFLLSLALLTSCAYNGSIIAHDQVEVNQEAVTEFEQLDEASQKRMIKVATFLSLIQKVSAGEIDPKNVIYFALEWAQELEKSDDAADQELCKKLYQVVIELTENLQAIEAQEEVEESQESSAN